MANECAKEPSSAFEAKETDDIPLALLARLPTLLARLPETLRPLLLVLLGYFSFEVPLDIDFDSAMLDSVDFVRVLLSIVRLFSSTFPIALMECLSVVNGLSFSLFSYLC